MPFAIRKLPSKELWRVYNKNTRHIYAYHTTLSRAKAQMRFLNMIEAKRQQDLND